MDAIETLTAEHRVMEQALDALEALATALESGAAVARAELPALVGALQEYLQRHDALEEGVLFVHLVARGFPPTAGPLAAIASGHARCRSLLFALAGALAPRAPGSGGARAGVGSLAWACVRELRELIRTEDTGLFPAARAHLPEAVIQCIHAELTARAQTGKPDRLEALVDQLTKKEDAR